MIYVLIILFYGTRADHIEFSTQEACMFAAAQVQANLYRNDRAFCVPKG